MAIPYERIVAEDLNLGYGTVAVTMPAGGTALGTLVGLHTFTGELNVKTFGATGDGVTDDTAAIQRCIDAVIALGGGTVYFPPGTYYCASYTNPASLALGTPLALYVQSSNVTLRGAGPSSHIIGGGAPTVSGGFLGLYSVGSPTYALATTYPIAAAAVGDFTVTLSTPAHAAHFVRGDIALLRGGPGLADTIQSIVERANASTGVVSLREALPKAFTGAPTIANVTAVTASNLHVSDLRITSSRQTFLGQQIVNVSFRRLVLDVCDGFLISHFQFNQICGFTVADNDISWTAPTPVDAIGASASSSHIQIVHNRLRTNNGGAGAAEGTAHALIAHNLIYCNDEVGEPAISCGSAYDVLIANNTVYFHTTNGSVMAIFESNGGDSQGVVIKDNVVKVTGTGNYAIEAGSRGTIVDGNTITTSVSGIWLVGRDTAALNNTLYLTTGGNIGVVIESSIHSQRVLGNEITNLGTLGGQGIRVVDGGLQTHSPVLAHNGITNFTTGVAIVSLANDPGLVVQGNRVSGCTTTYSPAEITGQRLVDGATVLKDLRRTTQTVTAAAGELFVDAQAGENVFCTITHAATIVKGPTNPVTGQELAYFLTQDGMGSYAVAFDPAFFTLTWSNAGNTAGTLSSIVFFYNGSAWIQKGAQRLYA